MNDVIEIAASFAECCIVVRLCNGFLGFKSENLKWSKSGVFFILLALNNVFLGQMEGFENISIGVLLFLSLVYSFVFLKGKIWEKLLVSVIPTVTALPINLIIINGLSALAGNDRTAVMPGGSMRLLGLLLSKIIFFILCEVIIKIKRKQVYLFNRFQQVIQLSCFLISFVIATLLWNVSRELNEVSPIFTVIFLLIIFLNILLYILMSKMQKDNITKEEFNLLKATLSAQERLAVEVKERYTEIKTLRHDMKHYFIAVAELISENKPNEAKEFIENIINEKINPTSAVIATGSAIIDAAINSKIASCESKGIEIKCMIDTQLAGVNDMDISILLSNLLDNAISGCDMTEPKIELMLQSKKSFTCVTVKNKISTSVLDSNPNLHTKKEDRTNHGYGIKSIKNIAKKYDGSAEYSEKNGYFIAEVLLKNTENCKFMPFMM